MCGIVGKINFTLDQVDVVELKKMTDQLIHRGPDGEGHWVSSTANVGLGHRRLSIIDLSDNAKQPFHYLEKYVITFNGEIYNYQELREELIGQGYTFNSMSDTEVILAAFDFWKEKCLNRFDGMFAFVIYDKETRKSFCARDRFGEKPFFYHKSEMSFSFASEMKALWAIGIGKIADTEMVDNFRDKNITFSKEDLSRTFYRGIKKLPHAHYMWVFPEGRTEIEKYWDINLNNSFTGTFEEAKNKFSKLLQISVERRLRSDVPVGSSLSGGLDSSIIVAEISRQIKENPISQFTFSAKFPGFEKDESRFAEMVVDHLDKIEGVSVYPSKESLVDNLDLILKHQEEPIGSASIHSQWEVYKSAKSKVTVMLDGQGADEFLAGYLPLQKFYHKQLLWHNQEKYKSEVAAYKVKQKSSLMPTIEGERETARMKLGRLKRKTLGQSPDYPKDYLKQRLYDLTMKGSLQELLRYADRNAMSHSIETRLPFLFHELVEFCFSLPDEFLINDAWSKYILRVAYADTLPNEIIWRKEKVGFEPPQKKWFNNESSGSYTNDVSWRNMIITKLFQE